MTISAFLMALSSAVLVLVTIACLSPSIKNAENVSIAARVLAWIACLTPSIAWIEVWVWVRVCVRVWVIECVCMLHADHPA